MKKKLLALLMTVFPLLAFGVKHEEILDSRLVKQAVFPRIGGWCQLPWKGKIFCASILHLHGDYADVRVIDTEVLYTNWPLVTFLVSDLAPMTFEKCLESESLITALKNTGKLRSAAIETAIRGIDRSWFCPSNPYFDTAIEIGHDMFISSPHMHIISLELCQDLLSTARSILDVGSGSGYLCAMFAELAPHARITGIEYYEDFIFQARKSIDAHLPPAYAKRIEFHQGNGEKGYLSNACYDIIYVGFMTREIPQALLDQLAPGGRLIIPVGNKKSVHNEKCLFGDLIVVQKQIDGTLTKHPVLTCSFVPSLGSLPYRDAVALIVTDNDATVTVNA